MNVDHADLLAAIDVMFQGKIPASEISAISITPYVVTVTRFAMDANGRPQVVGDDIARSVTDCPVMGYPQTPRGNAGPQ